MQKSTAAIAAIVALSSALGAALPALSQDGPAGLAFYDIPAPLPEGAPGTPIRQRALEGTMALPSAARNHLVMYLSRDPAGEPVAVTGTVSVPPGTPPEGGWPVVVWTHGTTGLAAVCGPSRDDAEGPEHEYIEVIRGLLDQVVASGHAVVATDYQGLGTGGFHPFLQGVPNGWNALDMLRAGRAVEPDIGTRLAVMGHSQGGQADLFTASLAPGDLEGYELVGTVAMAPGSQIADRLDLVMKSDTVELSLPYVTYTLISYSTTHPEIDLSRILAPEAIAAIPELYDQCMTHALTQGFWSTAIAKDQFVAEPQLDAFLDVAARNEPGTLEIAVPALIIQGDRDTTVFPSATDRLAQQLCDGGNDLEYHVAAGADHDGAMSEGGAKALAWLADRFAGLPSTPNCADLPKAGAE
jgi:pimeloyl-ACP methyl ester carboxylesterase